MQKLNILLSYYTMIPMKYFRSDLFIRRNVSVPSVGVHILFARIFKFLTNDRNHNGCVERIKWEYTLHQKRYKYIYIYIMQASIMEQSLQCHVVGK